MRPKFQKNNLFFLGRKSEIEKEVLAVRISKESVAVPWVVRTLLCPRKKKLSIE